MSDERPYIGGVCSWCNSIYFIQNPKNKPKYTGRYYASNCSLCGNDYAYRESHIYDKRVEKDICYTCVHLGKIYLNRLNPLRAPKYDE